MPFSSPDGRRLQATSDANGRNTGLTKAVVLCFFFSGILAGSQTRHHWPVAVADVGYAVAIGIVVAAAYRLYVVTRVPPDPPQ